MKSLKKVKNEQKSLKTAEKKGFNQLSGARSTQKLIEIHNIGMTFSSNQKWTNHIHGTGGVISCLNKRLFFIRRLKNHLNLKFLLKISDSLFNSKIRYGLQLLGSVRWQDSDPINQDLQALQKCQNKLLRILNGAKLSDEVSIRSMMLKFNQKSVNQINAQIKLNEIWKSVNIPNYPISTKAVSRSEDVVCTRAVTMGVLDETMSSKSSDKSFIQDATHIWNKVPENIKHCKTFFSAKKAIKIFVLTLPL